MSVAKQLFCCLTFRVVNLRENSTNLASQTSSILKTPKKLHSTMKPRSQFMSKLQSPMVRVVIQHWSSAIKPQGLSIKTTAERAILMRCKVMDQSTCTGCSSAVQFGIRWSMNKTRLRNTTSPAPKSKVNSREHLNMLSR